MWLVLSVIIVWAPRWSLPLRAIATLLLVSFREARLRLENGTPDGNPGMHDLYARLSS